VYDKLHLDRIPRRYTVEAGRTLADDWRLHSDEGHYDLWVYGPNGFVREFRGSLNRESRFAPEVELEYDVTNDSIRLIATHEGQHEVTLVVRANAYRTDGPWLLQIARGRRVVHDWDLIASHHWYDFTVTGNHFERRFGGRLETGAPGFSDPADPAG
jgi:phospholipase C